MKHSISDTGVVIKREGGRAVVRMKHEGSCRKCGAAAIGLCRGSLMQEVTVANGQGAQEGDEVKIGLAGRTQIRAYVLAYVIPAASLILGTIAGHVLGTYARFPPLEAIAGFGSLAVASFFSLRHLHRLDSLSSIEIAAVRRASQNPSPDCGGPHREIIPRSDPFLY